MFNAFFSLIGVLLETFVTVLKKLVGLAFLAALFMMSSIVVVILILENYVQ